MNILLVKHANCYGNLYAAIYMDKSKPKEVKKKWNVGLKVLNQANLLSETCYDGMACQYKGRIKTHYAMFCITEMFKNIDLCKITKKINNDFAVGRYNDEVYVIF